MREMTKEHKEKLIKARLEKKAQIEKETVRFSIGEYTIESYEYGYNITSEKGVSKFYSNISTAVNFIFREKIRRSGARTAGEIIEAVKQAEKSIYKAIKDASEKL